MSILPNRFDLDKNRILPKRAKNDQKKTLNKIVFENGSTYTGNLVNGGKLHGEGVYRYEGEFGMNIFKGHFKHGKPVHGILSLWNNELIYKGHFENGLFEGKGSLIWKNIQEYIGDFKNGIRSGQGTIYKYHRNKNNHLIKILIEDGIYENNCIVKGSIYHDKYGQEIFNGYFNDHGELHGKGQYIVIQPDKSREIYEGTFKNGVLQNDGQSKLVYSNGDFYIGHIKEPNKLSFKYLPIAHGHGKLITKDGDTYIGEFVNGLFKCSGRGHLKFKRCIINNGNILNDSFSGDCLIETHSGHIFNGECIQGKLNTIQIRNPSRKKIIHNQNHKLVSNNKIIKKKNNSSFHSSKKLEDYCSIS